jgi:hypothetical protein
MQSFGRIEALVILAYDITFNQLCFNFEHGFKSSVSATNLIHVSANHTTSECRCASFLVAWRLLHSLMSRSERVTTLTLVFVRTYSFTCMI